ncbi:2'-deoxycytidine 5'-triphosphate deaminase [Parvularcula bermudensis HTCC2503]|uniref:2'-deoxycytidine 5'-triphosphate deaminase n=1 Tax=Parvularcula bermudensis (strain ATCC BAA-594 / HTCC2503 / KCTC 12087) TaxID=314260 RepID=E0TCQ3_PARBH|nr:2'-deoxycytidine 5'-triphosphate deaminase [Parvularcula bermudensis]ADM08642.1 2'-deoxycytidine 5'-triphosphate deaminase [Parvularcula bermudensis HTCC2503]
MRRRSLDTPHPLGVFAEDDLAALVAAETITLSAQCGECQIQPASFDLTLGQRAWRIRAAFLPGPARSVKSCLDEGLGLHVLDLTDGAVLETGCVYLVELREGLALPPTLSARANPKSSTGRIDVFVRLVTDDGTAYDEVPAGYTGPLYAEVSPRTFSIVVRPGSSLNQLRIRHGETRLSDEALGERARREDLTGPRHHGHIHQGLCVSVDLSGDLGPVAAWRAKKHTGLIDVDRVAALRPEAYFDPLPVMQDQFLILDPGEFYILASQEELRLPDDLAAEMAPIDADLGAFRVHYAGFFDPGFGLEAPSRAVLEVRGYDAPFLIRHGQTMARLTFERLTRPVSRRYGEALKSHYHGQGLRLSKHFAAP